MSCYVPIVPNSTDKTSRAIPKYVQTPQLDLPFGPTPTIRSMGHVPHVLVEAFEPHVGVNHRLSSSDINQTDGFRLPSCCDGPRPSLQHQHDARNADQRIYSRIRAALTIFSPLICSRNRSGGTAGGTIRTSCHPSFTAPLRPFFSWTH